MGTKGRIWRTGRHDEANSRFSQFCKSAYSSKKWTAAPPPLPTFFISTAHLLLLSLCSHQTNLITKSLLQPLRLSWLRRLILCVFKCCCQQPHQTESRVILTEELAAYTRNFSTAQLHLALVQATVKLKLQYFVMFPEREEGKESSCRLQGIAWYIAFENTDKTLSKVSCHAICNKLLCFVNSV
jgi:hypothetical protein